MTINPSTPRNIDIYEAIERKVKMSLNCVQVGVVQSFDAENQLATIKIAMKQVTNISNDGTRSIREYPLLLECPTFILSGGNGFLTMPISQGDNCLVLFNDRDIDTWMNNGDGGVPTTARFHDLSDGFCLVGVRPLTDSLASYLESGIRLSNNGNSVIDLLNNLIETTAALFLHNGDHEVTGNSAVGGNQEVTGDSEVGGNLLVNGGMTVLGAVEGTGSGTLTIDADIIQVSGREIHAGNGATGTFESVTVVDGIVTGGTPV